jgi:lipopolysaccharide export system permease protein
MPEILASRERWRGVRILDRYLLSLMTWPMIGAMSVTVVAFLLERILRLLDLLSGSTHRFGFLVGLAANLVPHYLGLTLPAAFFIALFMVVARLNENSEIDAMLASGISLTRLIAPLLGLGAVLTLVSLILFGFVQPYTRYGFRAVMHAAQNAGWNGMLEAQTFVSPNANMMLSADDVDSSGRRLGRVFIRKLSASGGEEVTTARAGRLWPNADGRNVTLELNDGQQLINSTSHAPKVMNFATASVQLPLSGADKLLRARGLDARELDLFELLQQAGRRDALTHPQPLLAEFYGRLARALALPLLPLLAAPLALAAKRGGRAPGIIIAGLLLLAFQHLLQFGESLAVSGRALAAPAVGIPFAVFTGICLAIFLSSRNRPGETPVSHFTEFLAATVVRLRSRPAKSEPFAA